MNDRYAAIAGTLGLSTLKKLHNAKVLVVGAGGIGCEILKNLSLSGFLNIEIIDLDTIDVSNLNRQFLFRPEHVGKPKAIVAAEAAKRFNPEVNITSHYGNIKDPQFGITYFETFDVVLNALDNIDARRHVNRLCLATKVPLIDSGTTGYLGQVVAIIKGVTACYECSPKPTQKVYPICTIRSTPDKPVHCIVWAKELFKLIFGNTKESMLYEDPSAGDSSTYMHLVAFPSSLETSDILEHGRDLVTALFSIEVNKRIEMDVYKTAKVKPTPMDPAAISQAAIDFSAGVSRPSSRSGWLNAIWTAADCVLEMLACLHDVASNDATRSSIGNLSFDKDDALAMKFVCAAANLRCSIFGITTSSFHDTKGIAGNIIPAISTTNAIVAGVQVAQAIKLINAKGDANETAAVAAGLPFTYCNRKPTRRGNFLLPTRAEAPNPSCYVCSSSELVLQLDTQSTQFVFGDFVKTVIKSRLGFNEPTIMIGSSLIYEEGEDVDPDDYSALLGMKLSDSPGGGITGGVILTIDDFSQSLQVNIIVKHVAAEDLVKISEAAATDLFVVTGVLDQPKVISDADALNSSNASSGDSSRATGEVVDEDCVVIDDNDDVAPVTAGSKRSLEEVDGSQVDKNSKSKRNNIE